jgi:hypothetical protein
MTYLPYFLPVDIELRQLSYVQSVECSPSDERIGHVCMVIETRARLTLSMIAEIIELVEKLVAPQSYPQIELGDTTIVLRDLVYPKTTVEVYDPIVIFD